jgi:hypothetical protein
MLLATILLLGALPQSGELARSAANVTAVSVADAADANDFGAPRELPSMPTPKVAADADGVAVVNSADAANAAASGNTTGGAGAAAVQPPNVALALQPMKMAYTRPRETRGQRIAWYTLMGAGHGAAAFDAYSTRLAISGNNYATETNPFLRPFSHSNALYAATQVSPALMDFIGKRMMVSENRWVRKMWWLPQVAGSGFSVFAGVHNLSVAK